MPYSILLKRPELAEPELTEEEAETKFERVEAK